MKLKYHKIQNIPLEVCTAEQKIAYNLAFSVSDITKKAYKKCTTGIQKSDIIVEAVDLCMKNWTSAYDYEKRKNRYNIDAIYSALRAGMENYISKGYSILCSYEEIGKTFPALYL